MNIVVIRGTIRGEPLRSKIPAQVRVHVRADDSPELVPVVWPCPELTVRDGQRVLVVGYVHHWRTAPNRAEVVAKRILPADQAAAVRGALARVIEQLALPAGERVGA